MAGCVLVFTLTGLSRSARCVLQLHVCHAVRFCCKWYDTVCSECV